MTPLATVGAIRGKHPARIPTCQRTWAINSDVLLAAGLVLSTASQFRIAGSPLGPGELLLTSWLLVHLFTSWQGVLVTRAFRRMGLFWLCLFFSMAVGTLNGLATGEAYDREYFIHDVFAYPLLAAISCIMVAGVNAVTRLQLVSDLVIGIGILPLSIMLFTALGWIDVPGMKPWFWERFQGWSDNPNQLAMMSLVLLFVALYRCTTAPTFGGRARAGYCLILAIWIGRLSQSDSFTFAALVAGLTFAIMTLRVWMVSDTRATYMRTAVAWIGIVLLPALLVAAAPLLLSSGGKVSSVMVSLEKNGGKDANQEAGLRTRLWEDALHRGFESGMLGLGPGPHLQMPTEIAADHVNAGLPGLTNHPIQGSTANFEAHNTTLDLFTQGGFLLVAAFLSMFCAALYGVFRTGNRALTAMLCGLAVFGSTGLITRHPLFWFAIAICLAACDQPVTDVAYPTQEPNLSARGTPEANHN